MSTTTEDRRQPLRGKLPMALPPEHACPICGSTVHLTDVDEWGADDGAIIGAHFDCETEPDIDADEWPEWHAGHYAMPYVDWLPWEVKVMAWLNRHYHYREDAP